MTLEESIFNVLNDRRIILTHSRVELIRQIIVQYDNGQFDDTPTTDSGNISQNMSDAIMD